MQEKKMKIVPVPPTEEMIEAFKQAFTSGSIWTDRLTHAINALLSAAPDEQQGPSGYTDIETIDRWKLLRGTDYESVERGYLPFSSKPFKTDMTDCTTAVWLTPQPPNDSELLQKQLAIAVEYIQSQAYIDKIMRVGGEAEKALQSIRDMKE